MSTPDTTPAFDSIEEYLTAQEVARILRMSWSAFRMRIYQNGDHPRIIRLGPGTIRIRRSDLDEWIASHVVDTPKRFKGKKRRVGRPNKEEEIEMREASNEGGSR